MPTFLQVGSTFINVDRINLVDVVCSPVGAAVSVMVWMAGGGAHQLVGADAQHVLDFIHKHKVG